MGHVKPPKLYATYYLSYVYFCLEEYIAPVKILNGEGNIAPAGQVVERPVGCSGHPADMAARI